MYKNWIIFSNLFRVFGRKIQKQLPYEEFIIY